MQVNDKCGVLPISLSTLSKIRNTYFKHYIKKRVGDNFARCGKCDSLAAIILQHVKGSAAHTGFSKQLEKHQAQQESARNAYRCMRALSIEHPQKVLTIIHDKMDHGKTASPCFAAKNKDTDMFTKLPLSVTGMMAHGHGDERYAHYALDMYPGDCNHTVGSFARLLRDLEDPPLSSSRRLFHGSGRSPLYRAVLRGSEICLQGLRAPPMEPIPAVPLPPILHVQLDNCWKDNKCRFVKAFWSMLTAKGIFTEVHVSYLLVGHTHDDIDASFGRWSMDLREHDYPTIPLLMKSYMDMEKVPVIPHMIEELPDWRTFVSEHIPSGKEKLIGHTKAQQFKFYVRDDGWPVMQYKVLSTHEEWLPKDGVKMWKSNIKGEPCLPTGDPFPAPPRGMAKLEDVIVGLQGFIDYWQSICDHDTTGAYMGSHRHILQYWIGVKEALETPLTDVYTAGLSLCEGFWPRSRVEVDAHPFLHNGELREEHQPDDHYVGPANLRPAAAFRIADNVHEGHMLILRPQEQDIGRPIWVCRALSGPNLAITGEHPRQILVQWFTPTSTARDLSKKWSGWDSNPNFKWKRDLKYSVPDWQPIDCILAAWPLPEHEDVEPYKVTIPVEQIGFAKDNLRRCSTAERGNRVAGIGAGESSGQQGPRGNGGGRRKSGGRPSR